jgi:hypothetical protein
MGWPHINELATRGVNGRICSDLGEMKKAQEDARKEKQLARERKYANE